MLAEATRAMADARIDPEEWAEQAEDAASLFESAGKTETEEVMALMTTIRDEFEQHLEQTNGRAFNAFLGGLSLGILATTLAFWIVS